MNAQQFASLYRGTKLSPLALHAGFGPDECRAVRRHAERELSAGNHHLAAESFRVAIVVEPGEISNWSGLAACLRATGAEDDARTLEGMVALMKRRLT